MKILKMRLKRGPNAEGGTHYTYPPNYVPSKVKFGPVYEKDAKINHDTYQDIIIGVADGDVAGFLQDNNAVDGEHTFKVEEIVQEDANTLGNTWITQVEKITDQTEVLRICAKAAVGTELTQDEKDALDPDNGAVGINKSKSFETSLGEALAAF